MWLVDAYSRAEAHRLQWVKLNQDALRADTYQGLCDAVGDPEFIAGETLVGKHLILPSSFPGSPRAMSQNYLDAMAIVRKFGKPDFLITATAIPLGLRLSRT